MQTTLTYIPTPPPAKPFSVGDTVEVLDRGHVVLSIETVTKVGKKKVTTTSGREWTIDGEWFDGRAGYPFPTIRRKD